MLLTIPVNSSSPVDFEKFAAHLKRKGTMPGHTLAVVTLRQDEEAAFSFVMGLASLFSSHRMIVVPDQKETLLASSNRMFQAAVKDLHSSSETAMCYYDPGWRPVKSAWLDLLQSEHNFQNRPTVFGDPAVGPIVFAHDYPAKSRLIDFLPADIHWRKYLASEMINLGVKTDAIGTSDAAYIRPLTAEK